MRDIHDDAVGMSAAVRALAGVMLGDSQQEAVFRRACEATKALIAGADAVSVTLLDGGEPRTAAATAELALHGDRLQYDSDEGPCLDAARNGSPVLVRDLRAEKRWPRYASAALEAGVRGSLSVPLEVESAVVGAVNIYTSEPDAFDENVVEVAYDLAHYAGVVATATDELNRATTLAQQLQRAMESRAVIEQAKGILMAQRRCNAEAAFQVLVRLSQDSHRKLRDVAQLLVEHTIAG